MLLLNDLELEILKEIRDASYSELLNGKDSNGIPFLQQIFKLHQKIYGGTCSSCSSKISGYIFKLKNFNPNLQMETTAQNFQLKTGAMIIIPGSSNSYSNANITDDIAIEYLAKNPNRKQLFKKLPDNVDELILDYNEKGKGEFLTDQNSITIGNNTITINQAVAYLAEIGVKTKATTVDGVEKKISELTDEQNTLLIEKVNSDLQALVKAAELDTASTTE
ncbi:hypothetical protein OX284_014600 [Flavobacterium sp. SUN046]|uniref:hypothetical protein n=1 Tax=Flavobacterium sp. SUN046 TaxID=3002440 RepID=UPI002DB701C5|nr:hypothetical protein [Flavobacterium sp. SUN046]MEC4050666.1 hypothetical protein [Flavobacterium sp. SUN046]